MELREVKKNFLLKNFLLIKSEKSSKHVAFLADELLKRWDLVGRTDGRTDGQTTDGRTDGQLIVCGSSSLHYLEIMSGWV